MHYPKIREAKAIDDTTLVVEFTNHEVKTYDVRHLLETPMFYPLRQSAFFRSFKAEPGGYGIVWNEEIDISEYELWTNGVALDGDRRFLTAIDHDAEAQV
jgi:hypothetical protein